MKMRWLRLTKAELLVVVIVLAASWPLMIYLLKHVPIGLADPKPVLPQREVDRVHHPQGFSIIAPKGWQSFVRTTDSNDLVDVILIQPDIDARWSPKLIVQLYSKDEDFRYARRPYNYQPGKYLKFDARIYEGLGGDYHCWEALFSHQGKRYSVLLMLPHGHGPPRYDKVPDYWWPFLNSFKIEPNTE
ncbi:MAG TPA: hypothetical protein VMX13_00030 [Sedimentisphaerales bacterium]|nr:hypothetical protein [Sedimentisphaerales bacterium]